MNSTPSSSSATTTPTTAQQHTGGGQAAPSPAAAPGQSPASRTHSKLSLNRASKPPSPSFSSSSPAASTPATPATERVAQPALKVPSLASSHKRPNLSGQFRSLGSTSTSSSLSSSSSSSPATSGGSRAAASASAPSSPALGVTSKEGTPQPPSSPSPASSLTHKITPSPEAMQAQDNFSQGPLASQFELPLKDGASQPTVAQTQRPAMKIDPLDEESDSSDEDISSDSDSSDEEEGIEVISAEDSSDEEAKTQLIRKQSAQTAGTVVMPVTPKPTSEKGEATPSTAHSPTSESASTKDASTAPGMDLCCIEGCTKPHSNHVYNEAVGRMREQPNSQRMCRTHYIQGLGQCCVQGCTNKATNRNLRKGAKLPIKDGLADQLHKVCMEHWNMVDQQTKGSEGGKKGKRKKRDTKESARGKPTKRRRSSSNVEEVEAFLASELGGKSSGHSDQDSSGDEGSIAGSRRNSNAHEFYALKNSESKGEKRDRLAATLSEEDASSEDFDRDYIKRRKVKEENGKAPRAKGEGKIRQAGTPSRAHVHGHPDARTDDHHRSPESDHSKAEVQLLRNEVAQLRNELRGMKQFIKEAMADQLSALKSECLALIGSKLTESHEREMAQLRIMHLRSRPAQQQQQTPSASSTSSTTTVKSKDSK